MDVSLENEPEQDPPLALKTVAIIPAGGTGSRMHGNTSKQYLCLNRRPILFHTLKRFQADSDVESVILVVPPGDVEKVRSAIVDRYGFSKVAHILSGGRERQDSVRNGIAALERDVEIVVVHDAVRPFVSGQLLRRTIREAASEGAAVSAVPSKDTVKICNRRQRVTFTPKRERVWMTQTPQAFRRDILVRAYEAAYGDRFYGTDDAGLVERMGFPVKVVPGSYDNIKITTPEDLTLAKILIRKKEWSG